MAVSSSPLTAIKGWHWKEKKWTYRGLWFYPHETRKAQGNQKYTEGNYIWEKNLCWESKEKGHYDNWRQTSLLLTWWNSRNQISFPVLTRKPKTSTGQCYLRGLKISWTLQIPKYCLRSVPEPQHKQREPRPHGFHKSKRLESPLCLELVAQRRCFKVQRELKALAECWREHACDKTDWRKNH